LGSGHALDGALAEARRVFAEFLLDHIGGERGDRRCRAWQNAEERPDSGSSDNRAKRALQILSGGKEVRHLRSKDLALLRVTQVAQDLAHRKHSYDDLHDLDPFRQLVESKGETLDP